MSVMTLKHNPAVTAKSRQAGVDVIEGAVDLATGKPTPVTRYRPSVAWHTRIGLELAA